ncbi:jg7622 [Pararge aegeria aegeria]|uniref:Jg7622 protein n=1 Tax=Pararge aegeria aegeria TaxID=348720 RepID=A0A8S4REL0_9NEOP|nr:jg7622 [Pararge aegeria aegeria]
MNGARGNRSGQWPFSVVASPSATTDGSLGGTVGSVVSSPGKKSRQRDQACVMTRRSAVLRRLGMSWVGLAPAAQRGRACQCALASARQPAARKRLEVQVVT